MPSPLRESETNVSTLSKRHPVLGANAFGLELVESMFADELGTEMDVSFMYHSRFLKAKAESMKPGIIKSVEVEGEY